MIVFAPSFVRSGAEGDGVADRSECLVGVRTQRSDGTNADGDDESQHDCVFDCGWAILLLQEMLNDLQKLAHEDFSFR
jgi:hypothetical protein